MKSGILSILKYIFFLALGLFLVWWQFDKMSALQKKDFSESLHHANYFLLIPIVIIALLSHISRALRWKLLIEPMGYKPGTANTFYSVMSGYLVNTFVPRAGEILKCTLLSRYEKIPANKLFGTIVAERVFDLFCYFIIIIITIIVQLKFVGIFVKTKINQIADENFALSIWFKLLLLIITLLVTILFFKWLFKRFSQHKYITGFKNFYSELKEGFITIVKLKNRGWFIIHSIFIWLMYLLQIYVGFLALDSTSHLGIVEASSVLSLSTLAMIVSPGGIGAFPLAVQEVLLIYNVDNVSFGWLLWGISTAIIIIVGLISLGLLMYKTKQLDEAKQNNSTKNI